MEQSIFECKMEYGMNAKWAVNQSQLFKFVLIVNHLLFVTLSATGDWIRLEVLHATHVAARSDGGFV